MHAKRLSATLSDPAAKAWAQVPAEPVALSATPIALLPSRTVRTAWATRPYGLVRELSAQVAHDGESIYVRLQWESPTRAPSAAADFEGPIEGPDAFPDAVAVMFPSNGEAELQHGSEEAPVSVWRWAAGTPDTVENLTATGIGTLRPADGPGGLWARSHAEGTRWQVVFGRPLAGDGTPAFAPGTSISVGFAVWVGANQERAGLKASSQQWSEVMLDA
jgi:DMSO reductase family type II enzyme heme b subunit